MFTYFAFSEKDKKPHSITEKQMKIEVKWIALELLFHMSKNMSKKYLVEFKFDMPQQQ